MSPKNADVPEVIKKIHRGEIEHRPLGLSVLCPLYGRYTPIDGNCVDLHTVDVSGKRGAKKENFILPGESRDNFYDVKMKCKYAEDVSLSLSKPSIFLGERRVLSGVYCKFVRGI